jgi:poly(3-hydroxybutyrate) depolymerase
MAGLLAGCPVTQPQDTPVDHVSRSDQVTGRKYYLYVPSSYDRYGHELYPLVVTLHGTPPFDTGWLQIREWKALAERKKFIVVAPTLDSTQGILPVIENRWLDDLREDDQAILNIVREISSRYRVDKRRILLTGFSAGGYPMYFTGLNHPETFQMLVARACNADMRIFEHVKLTDKTRRIPTVIFFGKDDLKPIHKQSWEAFRWLRRHGWTEQNSELDKTRGGHLRRPETAYSFWMQYN